MPNLYVTTHDQARDLLRANGDNPVQVAPRTELRMGNWVPYLTIDGACVLTYWYGRDNAGYTLDYLPRDPARRAIAIRRINQYTPDSIRVETRNGVVYVTTNRGRTAWNGTARFGIRLVDTIDLQRARYRTMIGRIPVRALEQLRSTDNHNAWVAADWVLRSARSDRSRPTFANYEATCVAAINSGTYSIDDPGPWLGADPLPESLRCENCNNVVGYSCACCERCHLEDCECCPACERPQDDCQCCAECECYPCECDDDQGDDAGRHSWDYTPTLRYVTRDDAQGIAVSGMPYLGVELELETSTHRALSRLVQTVDPRGDAYPWWAKRDGSLSHYGAEIVCHPATLAAHQHSLPWAEMLGVLRDDVGAHAHDGTGLHVHISRDSMTKEQLLRFAALIYGNADQWRKIARRSSGQWANLHNGEEVLSYIRRQARCAGHSWVDDEGNSVYCGRYSAVNAQPPRTIELRLFRSTTDYRELMAAIESVAAARGYVGETTADAPPFAEFREYVAANDAAYPNLHSFITDHRIGV